MPYNLLLLPLIGGFLFLHIALLPLRRAKADGYRLLFQSAIAGIGLSALARMITVLVDLRPLGKHMEALWMMFSPFDYSGTSAFALLLGPMAAVVLNQFLTRSKSRDLEIERHGNYLLKLLNSASQRCR